MGRTTKVLTLLATLALAGASAEAGDFAISFNWNGVPPCTSGNPNTVSNPQFVVSGVPAGTKYIRFSLKDLNVPAYNHGGGVVAISQDGIVPPESFSYRSPCPPGGAHTYQWTAKALAMRGAFAKALATATSRRRFPE